MSISLVLTDGTTTLTLDGSGAGAFDGAEYAPQPPAVSALEAPISSTTEGIVLRLAGSSANIVSAIGSLELLLRQARRRQAEGSGSQVFLQYAAYDGATAWRSEILDGRLLLDGNPDRRRFASGVVMVDLSIERRAYWEATSETTLANTVSLTNNGVSSGALISGASIAGTMPSPAKIRLKNNSGSALWWSRFYLSNNAFNDPSSIDANLDLSEAGSSSTSWGGATTNHAYASWTLSTGLLDDCAGDYFRLLAAFDTTFFVPSNTYWSAAVKYSVTELAKTDPVWSGPGVTRGLYDLGALPLPPGGYYANNAALTLALTVRAAGAGQAALDFIQLMPTGPGRWRTWYQRGYQAPNGSFIVDDPYAELTYFETTGGDRIPLIATRGEPLMLWPGRNNRVTVIFEESDLSNLFRPSRATQITISHRPRRLTL